MKIKVLLADDNQLFRELLAERTAETSDVEIIGEADTMQQVMEIVNNSKPHIVLMEVLFKQKNGIEITRILGKDHPEVKVVALTNHKEKALIKGMLEANAWGYISKNSTFDQLMNYIREISTGKKTLSPDIQSILIDDYLENNSNKSDILSKRETEIMKLLAEGKSIREIAESNFISIKTAGTHKQNIFDKMGFENMAQLIKYALLNGIVS